MTVRGTLDEVKPFVMLLVVVLITLFSIAFIVLIMKLVYSGRFKISCNVIQKMGVLISQPIRELDCKNHLKTFISDKMPVSKGHSGRGRVSCKRTSGDWKCQPCLDQY